MNKKYNLKLDLQFRCNNSTMRFNEFDNNTSDFYIEITKGNSMINDLNKATVVLATIKPSTKVEAQFIDVTGNKVYADLKPNMRDEVGTYQAKAMIIFENERIVTDTITYEVKEDSTFRILNENVITNEEYTLLTEILSRLSTIELQESSRISNEADRLDLQNRLEELIKEVELAEVDRAEHEVLRERTHLKMKNTLDASVAINNNTSATNDLAKALITKVETTHEEVKGTHDRVLNTESRVVEIESDIKENEAERQKFYGNNQILIQQFKNAESQRDVAESIRIKNEEVRELNVGNYETRYDALISNTDNLKDDLVEINRVATQNEELRVKTEADRKTRYEAFESDYGNIRDGIYTQLDDTNRVKANLIREVNQAKTDLTATVNTELSKATKKVDDKIVEVDATKNKLVRDVTDATNEAYRIVGVAQSAIDVTNANLVKVDKAISDANSKISEVNSAKVDMINKVGSSITTMKQDVDSAKIDMSNTANNKANELEIRFNTLTSQQQNDSEVIDARMGHDSLKEKLEALEKTPQIIFETVEG